MIEKSIERQRAITLRQEGKTYSEILGKVPVAKSTLSLWLRDVGLSKRRIQAISLKKREAQKKGALARKLQRLSKTTDIFAKSKSELGRLTERDLFILGLALYWAEGSKEKEVRPGSGIRFANSDAIMVHLFARWLQAFGGVSEQQIYVDLYVHKNHQQRVEDIKNYWITELGLPITHVYYKRHNPKTPRQNSGEGYHGLVVLRVRSSSHIVRKLAGLVSAIGEQK